MSADFITAISVTGPDAFEFLQNQLAADLQILAGQAAGSDDEELLSAWCNPRGRVICIFRVSKIADGYRLGLPTELAGDVARRLAMFRFRSKVEFHVGEPAARKHNALEDLRAGIADIRKTQSEQFTPHMLNLDLIGAVSLDKGCYPGQEIVARTHYRGRTKRRLLRFESPEPLSPGDKVADGDRDVGEVVNVVGNELLAVVPLDTGGRDLTVHGSVLEQLPLPYL